MGFGELTFDKVSDPRLYKVLKFLNKIDLFNPIVIFTLSYI